MGPWAREPGSGGLPGASEGPGGAAGHLRGRALALAAQPRRTWGGGLPACGGRDVCFLVFTMFLKGKAGSLPTQVFVFLGEAIKS